jgi:hypothetical protein
MQLKKLMILTQTPGSNPDPCLTLFHEINLEITLGCTEFVTR